MIEYALLFALGFLAATLAGLLIAPAIQNRVVKFTEKRMLTTMPLSPQEVRAQKDMARAAYAVENARVSQDLIREREKSTTFQVRTETLLQQSGKLSAENADLQAQIAEMNVEAADMRSKLRREEHKVEQMKAALEASDREVQHRDREIATINTRIHRLLGDIDNLKIDLATRDTEVENLKSRIASLRDEREKLRDDLKHQADEAKEVQLKLSREEGRVRQLETKLSREIAGSADKDNVIERRIAEINRLRDKLKTPAGRRASRNAPVTGLARIMESDQREATEAAAAEQAVAVPALDISAMDEDVRNRSAALTERLASSRNDAHDGAMRDEIADVAARMVTLAAAREGADSPIHALLDKPERPRKGKGRRSLADRVREISTGK